MHLVLVAVTVIGYVTVGAFLPQATSVPVQESSDGPIAFAEQPNASWKNVTDADLMVVFVGEQTCPFSKLESVRIATHSLANLLREEAKARDLRFSFVGISVDRVAEVGIEYLRTVAEFDGVLSGRSWWKAEGMEAMAQQLGQSIASPQLLVFERKGVRGPNPPFDTEPFRSHELRFRLTGADEINRWMTVGSSVPLLY